MRSDIVSIEPEVVQFGREGPQTIKIVNNTNFPLSNFFFCLYNNQKFQFTPDSFSLSPNEHKLIAVNLKVKSPKATVKEFAYLKSTQINKRITLLINQFQSPLPKTSNLDEGYEDINTLSSRQYRDVQTQAIQKIIQEKQAYIAMLEKEREGKQQGFKTEQSAEKGNFYRKEYDQLSLKWALTNNQNVELQHQNDSLRQKYEEYRKYCQADLKNYEKVNKDLQGKTGEVDKLRREVEYLQEQGEQFLKKVEEKEDIIRELEQNRNRVLEEGRKQAEKLRTIHEQSMKQAQQKIRQLQSKLQQKHERIVYLQKNIEKKEEDVKGLVNAIESQRNTLRELDIQKSKLVKVQAMNLNITEQNSQLTSRLQEMQKLTQNLKEQIFVYKNKKAEDENSSDKMNQYLQIALESCRNENDGLKRTKIQLQKSLDEFMRVNRQSHDNNKNLSEQISKYKEEVNLLTDIKSGLERKNEELKQEHHLAMMKLKTENIELLEKMSANSVTRREEQLRQLQEELAYQGAEREREREKILQLMNRNELLEADNIKLVDKVRKYKKEIKKEMKNSNDTIIQELLKTNEEKQQMAQKITQLEQVIANQPHRVKRNHSSRLLEEPQLKKDRTSSRIVGIRDQRREIHETQKGYSQVSSQDYAELAELRELNHYLQKEEERLTRQWQLTDESDIDQSYKEEIRPLYRCINFFKKIQTHLREFKGTSQISGIKEVEYLKGRLRELEIAKEDKDMNISIGLNKTREQCGELLEFVREEMKTQYKKLNETIRLCEQKHEILKKKIYEEYRAKIIEVLNKKQKNSISQLEIVLERFIDAMSNLSHKEAVLQKEVKLKQNARKTNKELKQKINELNQIVQSKKGYCSRDPVKVYNQNEVEIQWQQTLKRQAQFLTLTAQHQRLKEELGVLGDELGEARQDCKRLERQVEEKSGEVLRLKKYQIEMQTNYEAEIQKQYEIVEENKRKIIEMTKVKKDTTKNHNKEKEYRNLKDNLQKQKDVIQMLRDKERMLNDILEESHRSEEKQRRKINEENRIIETMRDLKENNRELRNENGRLKEKIVKIQQQLESSKLYLKNVKEEVKEDRVRAVKKEEIHVEQLKEEVAKLTDQLKRNKEQINKMKRRHEKELGESHNEIDKLRNQNLINVKSLQSVIRALMDTLRKIYNRIKFNIKKNKGKDVAEGCVLFEFNQGVQVNALKIDQLFQKAMEVLEQPE